MPKNNGLPVPKGKKSKFQPGDTVRVVVQHWAHMASDVHPIPLGLDDYLKVGIVHEVRWLSDQKFTIDVCLMNKRMTKNSENSWKTVEDLPEFMKPLGDDYFPMVYTRCYVESDLALIF